MLHPGGGPINGMCVQRLLHCMFVTLCSRRLRASPQSLHSFNILRTPSLPTLQFCNNMLMYRFVPDKEGDTWSGSFAVSTPAAAPTTFKTPQPAKAIRPQPNAAARASAPRAQAAAAAAPAVRGGVNKRIVDGDYKKRRRTAPSPTEETLAKRRAAAQKGAATRKYNRKIEERRQQAAKNHHRAPAKMTHKTSGRGRFKPYKSPYVF